MFHYLKYSINTTNSIYFIQLIYFITILLSYLFLIIFTFYISFIFKLTNHHSIHIILNYLSIHQIIFHLIHFTIFELLKPIHLSSIEKTINSFKYSSLYNYQIYIHCFYKQFISTKNDKKQIDFVNQAKSGIQPFTSTHILLFFYEWYYISL